MNSEQAKAILDQGREPWMMCPSAPGWYTQGQVAVLADESALTGLDVLPLTRLAKTPLRRAMDRWLTQRSLGAVRLVGEHKCENPLFVFPETVTSVVFEGLAGPSVHVNEHFAAVLDGLSVELFAAVVTGRGVEPLLVGRKDGEARAFVMPRCCEASGFPQRGAWDHLAEKPAPGPGRLGVTNGREG